MSLSIVFETALGLILVFYVMSTLVSVITNRVAKFINLRATNLTQGLYDLLSDAGKYDEFLSHPFIQNLEKEKVNIFGKVQISGADFIPSRTFALTLFDILEPDNKEGGQAGLDALRAAINDLPEGKTRDALLSIINSGVTDIDSARDAVGKWYDDAMTRIQNLYGEYARLIVILTALIISVVLGVDTLAIGRTLWTHPTIRQAANDQVSKIIAENPDVEAEDALLDLASLQIPLFWNFKELPTTPQGWVLKVVGILLTWGAAAQGAPFWYDMLKKLNPA